MVSATSVTEAGRARDVAPRRTVLVADDQDRTRGLIAALLRGLDVELLEARDGRRALDAARRERPLLALLATAMPVLDGVEVCRRIRTDPALAATVVVMLTPGERQHDRARALAAGADGYLTTPFAPADLLAVVDKWTSGPCTLELA